jgi:hypothetical protein
MATPDSFTPKSDPFGIYTPKNSTYAGMTAPKGYEFGKVDKNQQMWAGNQLVAFRPLQAVQSATASAFGTPGALAGAYGSLQKPSAPAAPKPAPVIQGGAAILSGQSTPGRTDVAAEEDARRKADANAKPGTYRPTPTVAPDTATKILLGA